MKKLKGNFLMSKPQVEGKTVMNLQRKKKIQFGVYSSY